MLRKYLCIVFLFIGCRQGDDAEDSKLQSTQTGRTGAKYNVSIVVESPTLPLNVYNIGELRPDINGVSASGWSGDRAIGRESSRPLGEASIDFFRKPENDGFFLKISRTDSKNIWDDMKVEIGMKKGDIIDFSESKCKAIGGEIREVKVQQKLQPFCFVRSNKSKGVKNSVLIGKLSLSRGLRQCGNKYSFETKQAYDECFFDGLSLIVNAKDKDASGNISLKSDNISRTVTNLYVVKGNKVYYPLAPEQGPSSLDKQKDEGDPSKINHSNPFENFPGYVMIYPTVAKINLGAKLEFTGATYQKNKEKCPFGSELNRDDKKIGTLNYNITMKSRGKSSKIASFFQSISLQGSVPLCSTTSQQKLPKGVFLPKQCGILPEYAYMGFALPKSATHSAGRGLLFFCIPGGSEKFSAFVHFTLYDQETMTDTTMAEYKSMKRLPTVLATAFKTTYL